MVDFINIKNLFGIKKDIALECDKDGNGKLEKTKDFDEISLFNQKMNDYNNGKLNKSSLFTAARDATFVSNKPVEAYSSRKSVDLSKVLQKNDTDYTKCKDELWSQILTAFKTIV